MNELMNWVRESSNLLIIHVLFTVIVGSGEIKITKEKDNEITKDSIFMDTTHNNTINWENEIRK